MPVDVDMAVDNADQPVRSPAPAVEIAFLTVLMCEVKPPPHPVQLQKLLCVQPFFAKMRDASASP
jgi:hypothetical protein